MALDCQLFVNTARRTAASAILNYSFNFKQEIFLLDRTTEFRNLSLKKEPNKYIIDFQGRISIQDGNEK